MTDEYASVPSDVSSVADLERQLAVTLSETSEGLARAECFDGEQRAELYTILRTLRADTELHCKWVGQWVREDPGGGADA